MGNVKSAKSFQFPQKKKPEVFFGKKGQGLGEFGHPMAVAGGPLNRGHVYATDYVNNNVQVFDCNKPIPPCLKTFGEFNHPCGIAVNSSGYILVADAGNNRIVVFDSYCTFQFQFGSAGSDEGQFLSPYGVACDSDDLIYVSDYFNGCIQVFSPTGKFVRKIGEFGTDPGLFLSPSYLAVSGDRLYVSDQGNNCVKVFTTLGVHLFSFGTYGPVKDQKGKSELKHPAGIVVDPKAGLVYVGDSGNNRVVLFQLDGTYVVSFGSKGTGYGEFMGIGGLAKPSEDCLVVVDVGNQRVQVFRI